MDNMIMDKFIFFLIEHYYLSVPLLLVIILLIISNSSKGGKKISSQQLIELTNKDNAVLIDLRSSDDYSNGRITGSINIPFSEIEDRSHEIKLSDEKSLVLICDAGSQSANAGESLKKHGFDNSLILSGGISQWKMDNLPLV